MSHYFKQAEKDEVNNNLFDGLNKVMPEEVMGLIEVCFIQKILIDTLVDRLRDVYSLSEEVAEYLIKNVMAHKKQKEAYVSFYKCLFKHNWEAPCALHLCHASPLLIKLLPHYENYISNE